MLDFCGDAEVSARPQGPFSWGGLTRELLLAGNGR